VRRFIIIHVIIVICFELLWFSRPSCNERDRNSAWHTCPPIDWRRTYTRTFVKSNRSCTSVYADGDIIITFDRVCVCTHQLYYIILSRVDLRPNKTYIQRAYVFVCMYKHIILIVAADRGVKTFFFFLITLWSLLALDSGNQSGFTSHFRCVSVCAQAWYEGEEI